MSGSDRAADGSERWVAWTNRLQHDAQGKVLLHSVGRDVTDRRRAELALRASQAALARTGRIAGVGGWQLDLLTNTLEWSEQTRLIHEVGPDFVPSLENAVEFYAPQAREQVASVVRKALEDGTPWDLELPLVTARGRDIWVRAQGEVEFDGEVPVRIAGAFQDISERRRLTQALEDKERFVRQVTDALPVRIAYMDRALRFQFVNQAHCDRFGRPREQVDHPRPASLGLAELRFAATRQDVAQHHAGKFVEHRRPRSIFAPERGDVTSSQRTALRVVDRARHRPDGGGEALEWTVLSALRHRRHYFLDFCCIGHDWVSSPWDGVDVASKARGKFFRMPPAKRASAAAMARSRRDAEVGRLSIPRSSVASPMVRRYC